MRVYHLKITAAALILVGSAAFLIIRGVGEASIYYVHSGEFFREELKYLNKDVRINGPVLAGSLVRGPEPLHCFFRVGEGADVLAVSYTGPVPDALKEGAEVVVEGRYEGGRTMVAKTLMTKCPSKYEAKGQPTAESRQPTDKTL